jgi:hypothetical protein
VETSPRLTDLQYYVYECGVSIPDVAARIGTTNTQILTELATTPIPSWFRDKQDTQQGTGP